MSFTQFYGGFQLVGRFRHCYFKGGASDGEDNERRFKEYNHETGSNNLILKLRMMFADFHVFREALRTYSLKYGHEMWYKRNVRLKLKALCRTKHCPWNIYASSKSSEDKTLVVKSTILTIHVYVYLITT